MCRALFQALGTQQKAKQTTPCPGWGGPLPASEKLLLGILFPEGRPPGSHLTEPGRAALTNGGFCQGHSQVPVSSCRWERNPGPRTPWGEVCPGKASRREGSLAVAVAGASPRGSLQEPLRSFGVTDTGRRHAQASDPATLTALSRANSSQIANLPPVECLPFHGQ